MSASVTAVRVHELGEPAVMQLEKLDLPEMGPGEVRARTSAIGTISPISTSGVEWPTR